MELYLAVLRGDSCFYVKELLPVVHNARDQTPGLPPIRHVLQPYELPHQPQDSVSF